MAFGEVAWNNSTRGSELTESQCNYIVAVDRADGKARVMGFRVEKWPA